MKNKPIMNFTVNKDNSSIKVQREFVAPKDDVWAAWTQAELLDKWWGPKPWKSITKFMDFKAGGRRLYAMVGPDGEERWSLVDYTSITPKNNFKHLNAFCDKEGTVNEAFSRSEWKVDLLEKDRSTIVHITIKHKTLFDLEKYIEMGFKEGFTAVLENLDDVLIEQQTKKYQK